MKELSIEEKAKAYDEAINKIMDYRKGNTKMYSDVNKAIDYLFPELKESEDERIKKEITELVMQPTWKTEKEFHRRKELCAWLEKQGEQKPDDVEPIVIRDFNSVFSREQVEETDKRIEKSQRLYNAKLRDAMQKAKDFPMTD